MSLFEQEHNSSCFIKRSSSLDYCNHRLKSPRESINNEKFIFASPPTTPTRKISLPTSFSSPFSSPLALTSTLSSSSPYKNSPMGGEKIDRYIPNRSLFDEDYVHYQLTSPSRQIIEDKSSSSSSSSNINSSSILSPTRKKINEELDKICSPSKNSRFMSFRSSLSNDFDEVDRLENEQKVIYLFELLFFLSLSVNISHILSLIFTFLSL